jgi:hypothetical protein
VNVYDYSGQINQAGLWYQDSGYTLLLISFVNLSIQPNSSCGCGSDLLSTIQYNMGNDLTSPNLFVPAFEKTTLSIENNTEYVSFYDADTKADLGKSITKLVSEIQNIKIKQVKPNNNSNDIKIAVKSDASGIISRDTLTLKSEVNKHHLEFYTTNGLDYIIAGEKQPLSINLYSDDNCKLPDSLRLKAEIIGGSGYMLYNPSTGESGTLLNNVFLRGIAELFMPIPEMCQFHR